jgi:hypothetical protein
LLGEKLLDLSEELLSDTDMVMLEDTVSDGHGENSDSLENSEDLLEELNVLS